MNYEQLLDELPTPPEVLAQQQETLRRLDALIAKTKAKEQQ